MTVKIALSRCPVFFLLAAALTFLMTAPVSQASESLLPKHSKSVLDTSSANEFEAPEFLKVEEAFKSQVETEGENITIVWDIAPGYYLYKSRFTFKAEPDSARLGQPIFSKKGEIKKDEIFGDVEVFHDQVTIQVPVENSTGTMTLKHGYQGCAEAGLCYPPETRSTRLTLIVNGNADTSQAPATANKTSLPIQGDLAQGDAARTPPTSPSFSRDDANSLARFIRNSSLFSVIAVFFVIGLGLTFTPCVLPMVPILSSIIAGQQGQVGARKGFILSTAYVLGMALSFALAGLIVSLSGARIQIYMQHPAVLTFFSGLFVVLALSMFNLFELKLPTFLTDRLNTAAGKQRAGRLGGVFAMGAISALVVSPCVSPPLAGALLAMAQAGDWVKGSLTLLALGLGMGAPLIVIGTTGANFLPRAGQWMEQVKVVFGIMLLGVSIWLIRSVLPAMIVMWLWAALLIGSAVQLGALAQANNGWARLRKGLGIMLLIQGSLILVGAASGTSTPLTPLTGLFAEHTSSTSQALPFMRITTVDQLKTALASAQKQQRPVMLDFYADWCISCVEMEHSTFADAGVQKALSDFTLLQIDLTDNPQTNALLDIYDLFGPPSILFFSTSGALMRQAAIMGELGPEEFLAHLHQNVMPNLH